MISTVFNVPYLYIHRKNFNHSHPPLPFHSCCYPSLNMTYVTFFWGAVLGFELRAFHLLGRHSTTWIQPLAWEMLFSYGYFFLSPSSLLSLLLYSLRLSEANTAFSLLLSITKQ
jgi:hypothetical protein